MLVSRSVVYIKHLVNVDLLKPPAIGFLSFSICSFQETSEQVAKTKRELKQEMEWFSAKANLSDLGY